MHYDQSQIDVEFLALASQAEGCVEKAERGQLDPILADQHDECAAQFSVYKFLRPRPFLRSRETLLQELYWLRDSSLPVPENVYSPDRFASAQFSLVRRLIARFEHPAAYAQRFVHA